MYALRGRGRRSLDFLTHPLPSPGLGLLIPSALSLEASSPAGKGEPGETGHLCSVDGMLQKAVMDALSLS